MEAQSALTTGLPPRNAPEAQMTALARLLSVLFLLLLAPQAGASPLVDPAVWQWSRGCEDSPCDADLDTDQAGSLRLLFLGDPHIAGEPVWIDGEPAVLVTLDEEPPDPGEAFEVRALRRFHPGVPAPHDVDPHALSEFGTAPVVLRVEAVEDAADTIAQLDTLPWLHLPGIRVIETADSTAIEAVGDLHLDDLTELPDLQLRGRVRDRIERSHLLLDPLLLDPIDGPVDLAITTDDVEQLRAWPHPDWLPVDAHLVDEPHVLLARASEDALGMLIHDALDLVSGPATVQRVVIEEILDAESYASWQSGPTDPEDPTPPDHTPVDDPPAWIDGVVGVPPHLLEDASPGATPIARIAVAIA